MSRRLSILIAAPLLLASCRWPFAADSTETSGSDGFSSNSVAEYTQYADRNAAWSIADGRLLASGPGEQSVLIRNRSGFRDGWVEAEMDHADEGGLVLRFVGENDYYLLALRDDESLLGFRNVEFFRRRNGSFQILTPQYGKDIFWPRGVKKTVRFEARGDELLAYVDGVAVDSIRDPAPITSGGRVGMRYHDISEAPGSDSTRYLSLRWQGRR
jgi:hypothetical protein